MSNNPYGHPYPGAPGGPGGGVGPPGYPQMMPQNYPPQTQAFHGGMQQQQQNPVYTAYGNNQSMYPQMMQQQQMPPQQQQQPQQLKLEHPQQQPPPMSYHPQSNNFHNVSALASPPNLRPGPVNSVASQPPVQNRPSVPPLQGRPSMPVQNRPPMPVQNRPSMPVQNRPSMSVQNRPSMPVQNRPPLNRPPQPQMRARLPPGIQVQRTNSPPTTPKSVSNLPSSIQINREPAKTATRPKLPAGISISQGSPSSSNASVENKLPKSVSISRTPNSGGGSESGMNRLKNLAGISLVGNNSNSSGNSGLSITRNNGSTETKSHALDRLSQLNVSISGGNKPQQAAKESTPPPVQAPPRPVVQTPPRPQPAPVPNSSMPLSQRGDQPPAPQNPDGSRGYRPLVKDFRNDDNEGFDLSKVKMEKHKDKDPPALLPPSGFFQARMSKSTISITPASKESSDSENEDDEEEDEPMAKTNGSVEEPQKSKDEPSAPKLPAGISISTGSQKSKVEPPAPKLPAGISISTESQKSKVEPPAPKLPVGISISKESPASSNAAEDKESRKSTEEEQSEDKTDNETVEEKEEEDAPNSNKIDSEDKIDEVNAEDAETAENIAEILNDTKESDEAPNDSEQPEEDEEMAETEAEDDQAENPEESTEEPPEESLDDASQEPKTPKNQEVPEDQEETMESKDSKESSEKEQSVEPSEPMETEADPLTSDAEPETSEKIGQFKRPSETASIDGSSSKGGRERHFSTTSMDETESDQDRRQSQNEELAAQYAQQLAFYRKPIIGQDTVCIFCLTRCAAKNPKILTCLHSACEDCFKEQIEIAKREKTNFDAVCVDEDGCPVEPEVMVTCPLCKVTTSEKEVVQNFFLASEDFGDDEVPQTHMCDSCDDGNIASHQCVDCDDNLCEHCVNAHKRLKITKDHKLVAIEVQNTSRDRSITGSVGTPRDLRCPNTGEKLQFFCENCEKLICHLCRKTRCARCDENHKVKETHEVTPEVKNNLSQSVSDIRLKRNVLDENRALLGAKLSEVNIKEKSLMTQLQDLKAYMITKLDARFRELQTEVSKIVREKRKAIEGRKTVLDRYYVQADYALSFVDYSLQFSDSDDKALLVAKRAMERQLRRLKKVDPSTGLQSESGVKLDLYFQQYTSQKMHSSLESVLKQVLYDIKVLTAPPAQPVVVQPPVMHNPAVAAQAQMMQNRMQRMPSPQPQPNHLKITPVAKRSPMSTPTKTVPRPSPVKTRGSPIRGGMPASRGRVLASAVRGARGMPATRGSPAMRGANTIRGGAAAMATRGRGTVVRGGRGVMPTRGSMPARGGMAGRGAMPTRGAMSARGGAMQGRGNSLTALRGGGVAKPRGAGMTPVQRGVANAASRGAISITTVRGGGPKPPPLRASPQLAMRGQSPQIRGQQPQQYADPYYMAAYGKSTGQAPSAGGHPATSYGQNVSNMQSHHNKILEQQAYGYGPPGGSGVRPPQVSPGSSWHTPQGFNTLQNSAQTSQPSMPDNSFKITIPSKNSRPAGNHNSATRPSQPEVLTLDADGAPVFPPPQRNANFDADGAPIFNSTPGVSIRPMASMSTSISSSVPSLPSGISLSTSNSTATKPSNSMPTPTPSVSIAKPSDTKSTPDLSDILSDDDWQVGGDPSSHIEKDPLNIDPLASAMPISTSNSTSMTSIPMVSIAKTPSILETELDLGSITDPNKEVKTEMSLSNKNEESEKGNETPEMQGNDEASKNADGEDSEGGDDNDWCAVCHDGGDTLYCCDRCPKVYHLFCYIPPLTEEPPDDWVCDMCKSQDEIFSYSTGKKIPDNQLSESDQLMCVRILFELYNKYPESVMFRDCSDLNFKEYLDIIKEPIALDVIKEKLDRENPEMYSNIPEFLSDLRKMFRNCLTFHEKGSDFYTHGKTLEEFLDKFLEQWLPDYAYESYEGTKSASFNPQPSTSKGKGVKRKKPKSPIKKELPKPPDSEDDLDDESPHPEKAKKKKKKKKSKKSKKMKQQKSYDSYDSYDSGDSEFSNTAQLDYLDDLESVLERKKRKKEHYSDEELEPEKDKKGSKKGKGKKKRKT